MHDVDSSFTSLTTQALCATLYSGSINTQSTLTSVSALSLLGSHVQLISTAYVAQQLPDVACDQHCSPDQDAAFSKNNININAGLPVTLLATARHARRHRLASTSFLILLLPQCSEHTPSNANLQA